MGRLFTRIEIQNKLMIMRNKIRKLENDLDHPILKPIAEKELRVLRARYNEYYSVFKIMR